VLTQFGYHLIKVDARKGDTLDHQPHPASNSQSDSAAAKTDRRAVLWRAWRRQLITGEIRFGGACTSDSDHKERRGRGHTYVMAVHPERWPVGVPGRETGETSELFDAEDGYYLARLDSLTPGALLAPIRRAGYPTYLLRQKKVDALMRRRATLRRSQRAAHWNPPPSC